MLQGHQNENEIQSLMGTGTPAAMHAAMIVGIDTRNLIRLIRERNRILSLS